MFNSISTSPLQPKTGVVCDRMFKNLYSMCENTRLWWKGCGEFVESRVKYPIFKVFFIKKRLFESLGGVWREVQATLTVIFGRGGVLPTLVRPATYGTTF